MIKISISKYDVEVIARYIRLSFSLPLALAAFLTLTDIFTGWQQKFFLASVFPFIGSLYYLEVIGIIEASKKAEEKRAGAS